MERFAIKFRLSNWRSYKWAHICHLLFDLQILISRQKQELCGKRILCYNNSICYIICNIDRSVPVTAGLLQVCQQSTFEAYKICVFLCFCWIQLWGIFYYILFIFLCSSYEWFLSVKETVSRDFRRWVFFSSINPT
jgi:hypothetical protein